MSPIAKAMRSLSSRRANILIVAVLQKTRSDAFRIPMQGMYAGANIHLKQSLLIIPVSKHRTLDLPRHINEKTRHISPSYWLRWDYGDGITVTTGLR